MSLCYTQLYCMLLASQYELVGFIFYMYYQSHACLSLSLSLSLPLPQAIIKANNLELRCPYQCFINNEFVDASDGKTYQIINPTDEAAICELAASGAQDVEKAIKAAKVGSRSYVHVYLAQRVYSPDSTVQVTTIIYTTDPTMCDMQCKR